MANNLTPEQGCSELVTELTELYETATKHLRTIEMARNLLKANRVSIVQLQRQLAELSADHKRACLSLRSVERQLADLEAIKQQARKDALLELAGMVDAIKQRKLASRDIAHSNGRVVVAHCRQSDVETCDEIDGIIRSLVGERMANASPAEPIYRIPESGRAFSKDPNKPEGKIKHAPPTASGQGGER